MPEEAILQIKPADQARFAKLPDSAQRAYLAIKQNGPLQHKGLKEITGMPTRTIRFAVRRLQDEGFIISRQSLEDCRKPWFIIPHDPGNKVPRGENWLMKC